MANFTGKYLKVWEIEDKGNVKIINLGDSRKNKAGEYENCTWYRCLFVGSAAQKPIAVGDKIEVTSGQIFMEKYNEKWSPKVTVFHFDVMESSGGSSFSGQSSGGFGNQQSGQSFGQSQPVQNQGFGGNSVPKFEGFGSQSGNDKGPEPFEDDIPF